MESIVKLRKLGLDNLKHNISNNCNFILTYRCDNKCQCCLARNHMVAGHGLDVPVEKGFQFLAALSERIGGIAHINISGGEPMMHPEAVRFMMMAGRIVPKVQVNSNGYGLHQERTFLQVARVVHHAIISLHGMTAKEHDTFVGRRGSFEQATAAMANCLKYKLNFSLNVVVNKQNIERLPKMMRFIAKMGPPSSMMVSNLVPGGSGAVNYSKLSFSLRRFQALVPDILSPFGGTRTTIQFVDFPPCSLGDAYSASTDLNRNDSYELYPVFDNGSFKTMNILYNPGAEYKHHIKTCGKCSLRSRCRGPFIAYSRLFGGDGIVALSV